MRTAAAAPGAEPFLSWGYLGIFAAVKNGYARLAAEEDASALIHN